MTRMARFAAVAAAATLLSGGVHAQGNYATRVTAADGFVFVAEPENITRPGIVYAYRQAAGGQWTEAAKLTVPDGRPGDRFGVALAAHGTVLLVAQVATNEARGVVHVFERRGEAWQHTGRLTAADAAAQDSFGVALAIAGEWAAVGAAGRNGAVYVFRRGSDGRWTQEAKLTAADAAADDRFGAAVAIADDRVLVGAPGQANGRGAAYLYLREGAAPPGEPIKLVARTVTDGSRLGANVALLRQYAVAAAPGRDENTGAVYLFEPNRQGPGWAAYTRFFPYEGSSQSRFGTDLEVVGDELWIGAPGTGGGVGAVYRFRWDEARSDWSDVRKLAAGAPPGTGFSIAFAVAGHVAVAGLPFDEEGDGAAVVLARSDSGEWLPAAKLMSEPETFPAVTGRPVRCASGHAELFECGGIELLGFLPIRDIGGERGVNLNDIWGWTDPVSGREYALVGRTNGTAFVDVTDASRPRYLGDLPMTQGARANAWRDIKVYRDHAFIVADGAGKHGMQVFDLTQLRNVDGEPKSFTATALYENIFSAHNIVINEESGLAYAVGSNSGGETCGGGLHMIDIRDPNKPTFAGCFADPQTGLNRTGYSHDAQCVTYRGPHAKYQGREICFGSNETHISIADVTDRKTPVAVGRAAYPNVAYSHQGWLTDDHRFFYMDDEGDELEGSVPRTRTIIWDVTDLEDPQVAGEFLGATNASDHNLYIVGDTMYQSNYRGGLRVIDISDRRNPREIGYFDSVPNSENRPGFQGSWSNYPFFKSGNIVFTSIREGLFIVRMQRPVS